MVYWLKDKIFSIGWTLFKTSMFIIVGLGTDGLLKKG